MFRISALLIVIAGLSGCATSVDVRNAPVSAGVSRDFQIPFEKARKYALDSVKGMGLTIDSTTSLSDVYTINFSQSPGLLSWGEIGRVNVMDVPPDASRVSVYSLKRSRFQVTGSSNADFADTIFNNIQEAQGHSRP